VVSDSDRRVIVVTGAGSGIGRAAVDLFGERGYGVVAVDLRPDSLAWIEESGRAADVVTLTGDVSEESTNEAMVATAMDHFGRIDAMALNAGMVGTRPFEDDGAIEALDRILAVNVRSIALGIRHGAPALRAAGGGAIVATASTSGMMGDPANWAYNASKAAVINLVRAAAIDYATQGIRVNAVAPGPTLTGMTEGLQRMPELYDDMARRIPMQRWGLPREQAEVIWFLASPASSFVTGVTIACDGGITANVGHFLPPATPGGART
jgi:NAD(P)-dependent dehydrogenase (short-subunit alcohol dehydrogenase family)